jgi:hypothetical protein
MLLYVKTNIHFLSHLAQFFLELKMFQTKFIEKPETYFMFNNFFFTKIVPFIRLCGKQSRKGHRR